MTIVEFSRTIGIGANYTVDLKTNTTFQFFDTATTWYITKVVGYKQEMII